MVKSLFASIHFERIVFILSEVFDEIVNCDFLQKNNEKLVDSWSLTKLYLKGLEKKRLFFV
jgi:hypothetical protein